VSQELKWTTSLERNVEMTKAGGYDTFQDPLGSEVVWGSYFDPGQRADSKTKELKMRELMQRLRRAYHESFIPSPR
jgi:hypothetical protein